MVLPDFGGAPFAGCVEEVLPRRRLGGFSAGCQAIAPLLLA